MSEPMPRLRRSGTTYSSSSRATCPAYQTFGRSVTRATATAGVPARMANVVSLPRSTRSRAASTSAPGVGVSNSVLKSCNSWATSSASSAVASRGSHRLMAARYKCVGVRPMRRSIVRGSPSHAASSVAGGTRPRRVAQRQSDDDDIVERPDDGQELRDQIDRRQHPQSGGSHGELGATRYRRVVPQAACHADAVGEERGKLLEDAGRESPSQQDEHAPRRHDDRRSDDDHPQPIHRRQTLRPSPRQRPPCGRGVGIASVSR